jgi:hypothetical protein
MFNSIVAQSKILRVNLKNKEKSSKDFNISYDSILDIYSKLVLDTSGNRIFYNSSNVVLDSSSNVVLDSSSNKINNLSIRHVETVNVSKCCLYH